LLTVFARQLCTNTHTKLYEKLLLEHKQLRDRHKALEAELKVKGISLFLRHMTKLGYSCAGTNLCPSYAVVAEQ
jgi:hypothetical protein